MSEEHVDTQDQPDLAEQDYEAPKLTDLGSFEDLTQLSTGPNPDSEGTS